MAKNLNFAKIDSWRQRLAKFEGSGLSVAAFCGQLALSPARFYYWAQRVRESGAGVRGKASTEAEQLSEAGNSVELFIGGYVRVRLPCNDRELINSVLASLQASVRLGNESFQRIDVRCTSVA